MSSPLHSTIAGRLRKMILSSDYTRGKKLPSEPALSKILGVSRATLREAMKELESEGMIIKKRGSGTYVRALTSNLNLSISVPRSVTALIESLGFLPGTSMLKISIEKIFPDLVEALNLPPDSNVIRIERIRTANSQPVAYTIEIIPEWVMKHMPDANGADNFSITSHIQRKCGIKLKNCYGSMIPFGAVPSVAEKLATDTHSHIFLFEGVTFSTKGDPVIHSREYFAPWIFRMNVERRP